MHFLHRFCPRSQPRTSFVPLFSQDHNLSFNFLDGSNQNAFLKLRILLASSSQMRKPEKVLGHAGTTLTRPTCNSIWKTVMADIGPCLICEVPESYSGWNRFSSTSRWLLYSALRLHSPLPLRLLQIKASQFFDAWNGHTTSYNHLVFIRMSLWSDEKNRTWLWHGLFMSILFWLQSTLLILQSKLKGKQLSKQPLCSNFLGWSHEAIWGHEAQRLCFHRLLLLEDEALQSLQGFDLWSIFGPSFVHRWSIVGPVHRHMVQSIGTWSETSEHLTSYLVSSMSAKSLATCQRFD